MDACTPRGTYQASSAGGVKKVQRVAKGMYRIKLPALMPADSTTAQITAYGSGSEHCTIGWRRADDPKQTVVNIECFDSSGGPADAQLTLTYLMDDQVLF